MRFILLISFVIFLSNNVRSQTYKPSPENLQSRQLFEDMKFGMFIHWGPYSVLGNGEWVLHNQHIKLKDYINLKKVFNPIDFDAAKWVGTAKKAGMKYITFTSRHHDGFSNWDTKQSDWKITNTPYNKDVLKLLANECHKQGIKIFFYYSLLDWYRTDYPFETGQTGKQTGRTAKGEWSSYIAFMKAQLTELLTNYGSVAGIWFDGQWDQINETVKAPNHASNVDWHFNEIYSLIHQIQPQCLIGNNHHTTPFPGEDFQLFEKDLPGANTTGWGTADVSHLPLETCETMNQTWGYSITDKKFKTSKQLIHYLVNAAGYNANFLLNVGPMPNGEIQPEFLDTLSIIGKWMDANGESIYGTRGNIIAPQQWGVLTGKDKSIYAHVTNNNIPATQLFIPFLKDKIISAIVLKDKTKLQFKQQAEGVFVYLNGVQLDPIDTIIKLTLQ